MIHVEMSARYGSKASQFVTNCQLKAQAKFNTTSLKLLRILRKTLTNPTDTSYYTLKHIKIYNF